MGFHSGRENLAEEGIMCKLVRCLLSFWQLLFACRKKEKQKKNQQIRPPCSCGQLGGSPSINKSLEAPIVFVLPRAQSRCSRSVPQKETWLFDWQLRMGTTQGPCMPACSFTGVKVRWRHLQLQFSLSLRLIAAQSDDISEELFIFPECLKRYCTRH